MTETHPTFDELNSSPIGQNGRHFIDDIFRCIFVNEKFCILIKIWLQFVPKGPIDKPSTGLDNGLAPNTRQAIIWTNDDTVHWRVYAALGGDELVSPQCSSLSGLFRFVYGQSIVLLKRCPLWKSRIIQCMRSANERRRYHVTSSLIGWVHTQNDLWKCHQQICICNLLKLYSIRGTEMH